MKLTSLFIPLTTALIVTGCAADDVMTDIPSDRIDMQPISQSRTRSIAEAAQIAVEALPMIDGNSARSSRTFDMSNAKIYTTPLSRSDVGVDTLMYVFNFDNEAGFAAVAADRAAEGLIAITEKGSYDPAETPDNPGLAIYMAAAKEYLSGVSTQSLGDSLKPIGPPVSIWDDDRGYLVTRRDTTSNKRVYPRIGQMHWGQKSPEGDLFKNKYAGAANTAAAMVMTYLKYPTGMEFSYPNKDISYQIFDWDRMFKHKLNGKLEIDKEVRMSISRLCRELGWRTHSNDSKEKYTWTDPDSIQLVLKSIGLSLSQYMDYGHFKVQQYLNNTNMIIMYGWHTDTNFGFLDHMWIIDGYHYFTIHTAEYFVYLNPLRGSKLITDYGSQEYLYNHINWGWDGNGNGYFSAITFDPNSPYLLDDPNKKAGDEKTKFISGLKMFSVSKP